jgi:molecular chaperone DnaK
MAALRDTLETENVDKIKSGINNLRDASMKLGEAIYKAQQEAGEGATDEPRPVDDDIVDADFEDLDDKKRRD